MQSKIDNQNQAIDEWKKQGDLLQKKIDAEQKAYAEHLAEANKRAEKTMKTKVSSDCLKAI